MERARTSEEPRLQGVDDEQYLAVPRRPATQQTGSVAVRATWSDWHHGLLALSLWVALTVGVLASCADTANHVARPAHFPKLPVPAGNSLTQSRISVENRLFYDKPVSRAQAIICGSCCVGARRRTFASRDRRG